MMPTEKKDRLHKRAHSALLRKTNRFSTAQLLVFAVVFAAIGGFLLLRSYAAVNEVINWETGDTSQTTGLECPSSSKDFSIVTNPVRQGKYAAHMHLDSTSTNWSNGWPRCLATNYNSNETTGNDYYYSISALIPSLSNQGSMIWELHDPYSIYSVNGCALAPFALYSESGYNHPPGIYFRIVAGNCTPGQAGWPEQELALPVTSLVPYPTNTWMDFIIHIKFAQDNTGVVEIWDRTGSNPFVRDVYRSGIPTMMTISSLNVYNVSYYTEMGLYNPPLSSGQNYDLYLDNFQRGTSFADVSGNATTSGGTTTGGTTSSVTATSSITSGAVLSCTVPWTITTSSAANSVNYYVDNNLIGNVVKAGATSFTYNLDTTKYPSATGGGFWVLDSNGNALYKSQAIPFTVSPCSTTTSSPVTATSSITNGASLTCTVPWTITTSAPANSVNYYVNNVLVSNVVKSNSTSFTYSLDTTKYPSATGGGFWVLDSSGNAVYKSPSIAFTVTPCSTTSSPSPSTSGLTAVYYNNMDFTGTTYTRTDPSINFNWGSNSPAPGIDPTTYSVRWTGKLKTDTSGSYQFSTTSDDGIRVWVNGQLIINNWTDHAPTTNTAKINLSAGQSYDLKVEFYNNGGGAVAQLYWQRPNGIVPPVSLTP